jgi:hypothetical protein
MLVKDPAGMYENVRAKNVFNRIQDPAMRYQIVSPAEKQVTLIGAPKLTHARRKFLHIGAILLCFMGRKYTYWKNESILLKSCNLFSTQTLIDWHR